MTDKQKPFSKTTQKHANKPRGAVRREEYAITDDSWIKRLLNEGVYGTLATVHESQPFLTPILFIYIEGENAIYFHGAQVGRMRANMEINPNVCFNVTEVGRILPYEKAVNFNIEYNSATVFGTAEIVEDKAEVERLLQLIMDKYAPHLKPYEDYIPSQPEDIQRTMVARINIEEWTGKQQADEDGEAINPYYHDPMPVIQHVEK